VRIINQSDKVELKEIGFLNALKIFFWDNVFFGYPIIKYLITKLPITNYQLPITNYQKMIKTITFLLILFILPFQLYAIDRNPIEFADAEQEKRYQALIEEYRCVVCQNQSVADSNAELAQDVRNLVRNKILAGQTDQQITEFLVERYGDFVLYNPPLEPKTYPLWWGPLVLVLLAFIVLIYSIRRHIKTTTTPPTLSDEERNKVKQVLGE